MELSIDAGYYLAEKFNYPTIRKILNVLFNLSIASFIYEKYYGPYAWVNFNDYGAILNFFTKGCYIIPFIIFVISYFLIEIISFTIFEIVDLIHYKKITSKILLYQLKKETGEKNLNKINSFAEKVTSINLSMSILVGLYNELKNKISSKQLKKLQSELTKLKENIKACFGLAFRIIIATTIYFLSIQHFDWPLYIIVTITLFLGMYLLQISYHFFDVLPALARKFHYHVEEFIQLHCEDAKNEV